MASYTITAGETVETRSKRDAAIERATELRNELRVDATVTTAKGTEVFQIAAPRRINMSKPYTRVTPVPAEVAETINGKRVAYKRTRVGFALLDAARGAYSVWDLKHNRPVPEVEVSTTREFGRWVADESPAYRAELEAELEGANA